MCGMELHASAAHLSGCPARWACVMAGPTSLECLCLNQARVTLQLIDGRRVEALMASHREWRTGEVPCTGPVRNAQGMKIESCA